MSNIFVGSDRSIPSILCTKVMKVLIARSAKH